MRLEPQAHNAAVPFFFFQAVEEFLAALRSRERSQNAALVSQITAVKFLMARKFDVSRAVELFHAYKVNFPYQDLQALKIPNKNPAPAVES